MSALAGQWCGQTQPHDPHNWASQYGGNNWNRHCAGYTSKPSPGPCWHDSGITWPTGEVPRCELLAGHEGAHTWKRPNGGEAVWETTDCTTHRPEESPDE